MAKNPRKIGDSIHELEGMRVEKGLDGRFYVHKLVTLSDEEREQQATSVDSRWEEVGSYQDENAARRKAGMPELKE